MALKTLTSQKSISKFLLPLKQQGKSIGLIYTMGFLHEGHAALIKKAKKESDSVIVSIFINPSQFGRNEDISKYPISQTSDKKLLTLLDVDALFLPKEDFVYPHGYSTYINMENMSNTLCGLTRPNYFKGVITLVAKLFNILKPTSVYIGEKDYQESILIRQMSEDLNFDVLVKTLPTVRGANGLALSVRNSNLNERQMQDAPQIYEALQIAKMRFKNGVVTSQSLINEIKHKLETAKTIKIDYVCIVESQTLTPLETATQHSHILIACYCGATRLIDNISLK